MNKALINHNQEPSESSSVVTKLDIPHSGICEAQRRSQHLKMIGAGGAI